MLVALLKAADSLNSGIYMSAQTHARAHERVSVLPVVKTTHSMFSRTCACACLHYLAVDFAPDIVRPLKVLHSLVPFLLVPVAGAEPENIRAAAHESHANTQHTGRGRRLAPSSDWRLLAHALTRKRDCGVYWYLFSSFPGHCNACSFCETPSSSAQAAHRLPR